MRCRQLVTQVFLSYSRLRAGLLPRLKPHQKLILWTLLPIHQWMHDIVYAVNGSSPALVHLAFSTAAHAFQRVVCNPRRLFIQTILVQATVVGNAGVATKDLPGKRLLFSGEVLQLGLRFGV